RPAALVAVPPPLDPDVFHGAWQSAALLHSAVLDARLCQLHARRRHPTEFARNLERRALSGIPPCAAQRAAAVRLCTLRLALESLMVAPEAPGGAHASPGRPRVAMVIPTLNEEAPIAEVIRAIPRDVVDEVIVVDSGSTDRTVERARDAG